MSAATFGAAVNCMDGRVQTGVTAFLKKRFGVAYVDMITEPGPNRILGEQTDLHAVSSILRRLDISVRQHGARGIAVVGHEDCAGNPADRQVQTMHLRKAVAFLRARYASPPIIALWADTKGAVEEIAAG